MKTLNFTLLLTLGLFFAGTQFSMAQEKEKVETTKKQENPKSEGELQIEKSELKEKKKATKTTIKEHPEGAKKNHKSPKTKGENANSKTKKEDD